MKISEVLARRAEQKNAGKPPEDRPRKPVGRKALKVIRTRETPNPKALQFVVNAEILEHGYRSFTTKEDSAGDSLAMALLNYDEVKTVYVMKNFVTVTMEGLDDWNRLKTPVWNIIDDKIHVYPSEGEEKKIDIDVSDFTGLPQDKKLDAIEMVLDRSIRFQLSQDGGGVDLKGLEGNEVQIHYQGACGDCPSSKTGTLQHIERLIKQQLDGDLTVISV
ncbi:MAG: NifU family protein [Nitrospinae bacterium]|nr:NifU family protein [Nitrospinota bacterium]